MGSNFKSVLILRAISFYDKTSIIKQMLVAISALQIAMNVAQTWTPISERDAGLAAGIWWQRMDGANRFGGLAQRIRWAHLRFSDPCRGTTLSTSNASFCFAGTSDSESFGGG
jgi:hypothetical protein